MIYQARYRSLKREEKGCLAISESTLTQPNREILEGTTATYTATLQDENGDAIPSASLSALTLTYYDLASGDIINSRNAQNVLGANNVTVHATSGLLTWSIQAEDTVINGSKHAHTVEPHIALFEWTTTGGSSGKHLLQLDIKQLEKVT